MKTGYLKSDRMERFNLKRGWFVTAWRIVNERGQDLVQPWASTKSEARETAKSLGINLIESAPSDAAITAYYTDRANGAPMSKPLEWKPLWDAMDAQPTEWIETTEQMYWNMLECLPPQAMRHNAFLVGEPLRHVDGQAVHACFWERADGTYWARNLTVAEFRGMAP